MRDAVLGGGVQSYWGAVLVSGAAVDSGSRRGLSDGFGTVAAAQLLRVGEVQVVNLHPSFAAGARAQPSQAGLVWGGSGDGSF